MINPVSFQLSAEELAMALSLIGKPEIGKALLASHFGDMPESDVRSRLLAASHSLMSKDLLVIDAQTGEPRLAATLIGAVSLLAKADFSIRFSRVQNELEQNLTYHYRDNLILQHQVKEGIVHFLSPIDDESGVIEGGFSFLSVREAEPFTCPEIEIPASVLEQAKESIQVEPQATKTLFKNTGIPEFMVDMLTEDLKHTVFRGSGLRIEYQADGQPLANHGFLILRGVRRFWIFHLLTSGVQPRIRIRSGTEENLAQEIRLLGAKPA